MVAVIHPWQRHPLESGAPPAWADAWGEDAFGPWVELEVGAARQRWRWMPAGEFLMGSPPGEVGRYDDEGPQHLVVLTEGFWLADTPCTQALWTAVMGSNPSHFTGERRPVDQVSWHDVQAFVAELNRQVAGLDARLPTEAEWEYACRAGTTAATYAGDLKGDTRDPVLDPIAWYDGNSQRTTQEVATRRPNPWGLYDMLGNVWEWCADARRAYGSEVAMNPRGALPSEHSDVRPAGRGGSWNNDARNVRAAYRSGDRPSHLWHDLGFRLARGQRGR